MGGGRKSKQFAEVAPIFRNRKDGGAMRAEDGHGYDSDSVASDTSRATTSTHLNKKDDLQHLLHEIKANMTAEFDKNLTPIKEGLIDLTHRTTAIEEQLDRTATRTTVNENAIASLQDQVPPLKCPTLLRVSALTLQSSPLTQLPEETKEALHPGMHHRLPVYARYPTVRAPGPKTERHDDHPPPYTPTEDRQTNQHRLPTNGRNTDGRNQYTIRCKPLYTGDGTALGANHKGYPEPAHHIRILATIASDTGTGLAYVNNGPLRAAEAVAPDTCYHV
ncbi:Hypothetical predicted protein [Pelobates cultripes]|uniref:Uncharacterized protein n=1 Tax=Pelobates cultripes TaxID=61616 RepID=A0AAD1REU0_PELCU|nr:Hypothetical predicted protein [Pelobates cultripes]